MEEPGSILGPMLAELAYFVPLLLIALAGAGGVKWATRRLLKLAIEYGSAPSRCGLTGEAVAKRLLAACGLKHVTIGQTDKQDHYHSWRREVRLNRMTFATPSLVALAVAAHEVGHAEQFAARTLLCRVRAIAWPLCYLLMASAIVPLLLSLAGVWTFPVEAIAAVIVPLAIGVLAIQLPIHLPLERDATRRARRMATKAGLIGEHEVEGFDRVLAAAWWTHFAFEAQRWGAVLVAAGIALWAERTIESSDALAMEFAAVEVATEAPPTTSPTVPPSIQPPMPIAEPLAIPSFGDDLVLLVAGPLLAILVLLALGKLKSGDGRNSVAVPEIMELNNAGFARLQAGDGVAAVAAFSHALAIDPDYLPAILNRARAYWGLERLDEALRDYDACVRLAPGSALPMEQRGHVFAAQRFYDRANSDFSAVIEIDPLRASAFRDRGLMWYFQNDFRRGLEDVNRAIELDDSEAASFNNRGATWLKLGEYANARADLETARTLDANFPHVYKNLAWLAATCPVVEFRSGAAALANATKALHLTQAQIPEWFGVMAAAYAEAGDFASAVRWQRKFREAAPAELDADAAVALALFESGWPLRDPLSPHDLAAIQQTAEFEAEPILAEPVLAEASV